MSSSDATEEKVNFEDISFHVKKEESNVHWEDRKTNVKKWNNYMYNDDWSIKEENYTELVKQLPTVNGNSYGEIMYTLMTPADVQYNPCEEAYVKPNVPVGDLVQFKNWDKSNVFPDTSFGWTVYIPKQLKESKESPAVAIFQDGSSYLAKSGKDGLGQVRANIVMDNLIHQKKIPVCIGIFVDPGEAKTTAETTRSADYDSPTPLYAMFLEKDIMPFVEKNVIKRSLTKDPTNVVIIGISSGGICAFNAAWHRPNIFGNVISHCGSFVDIRGGHEFPYWIRRTERKPIKVFLQSGERDAILPVGDWSLANILMHNALEYSGYNVRFEYGFGGHNLRHGGSLFAESLRWIFDKNAGKVGARNKKYIIPSYKKASSL